jgi:ribosome-interacting GTPase 1
MRQSDGIDTRPRLRLQSDEFLDEPLNFCLDLVDGATMESIEEDLTGRFGERPLMISAASGFHMEELKDAIFDHLGFIRVYMKPQGGAATWKNP